MDTLFLVLLKSAVSDTAFERQLSDADWLRLYSLSKKHAVIGLAYNAISKSKTLTLTKSNCLKRWEAEYLEIVKNNEYILSQTAYSQRVFECRNLPNCVLKGSTYYSYYGPLWAARQSGDIDLWSLPFDGESRNAHFHRVIAVMSDMFPISDYNGIHINVKPFYGVDLEMHFSPLNLASPFQKRKITKWLVDNLRIETLSLPYGDIHVADVRFNLVYLLFHCYTHFLYEGVGMRQIIDYYMVLRSSEGQLIKDSAFQQIERFGLNGFAAAVMWVLQETLDFPESMMLCEPQSDFGRFLMDEIESGGNFGQYGKDGISRSHSNKVAFFLNRLKHNFRFLRYCPGEVIWGPIDMLGHFFWKRIIGIGIHGKH